jgi:hypothetical protein
MENQTGESLGNKIEGFFNKKKKPEADLQVEKQRKRETEVSEFLDTSRKINFKIAVLRYITYNQPEDTDSEVKEQARFAAGLLRIAELNYAKVLGIHIDRDDFNSLGSIAKFDDEQFDMFSFGSELKPGDDVVVVQPLVKGIYIPGYASEIVYKPQVCSLEYFLESSIDDTKEALKNKSADSLTESW